MNNEEKHLSRRQMLQMGLGFGGLAILGGSVFAQTAERFVTPEVGMGPFYPMLKPLDKDADLTSLKGQKGVAAGAIVHVAGRVLDMKGNLSKARRSKSGKRILTGVIRINQTRIRLSSIRIFKAMQF